MPAWDPYSGGARAVAVALRTAHLLCMAVFVGAVFAGGADPWLPTWRWLAFASGAGLLLTEVTHGRHWPWQGRGVATLAHVAVLGLLGVPGLERWAVAAAGVVGSVGSHMPRSLRQRPFRPGRGVE